MRRTYRLHTGSPLPNRALARHLRRMNQHRQLAETLYQRRVRFPDWRQRYDRLVARLRALGIGVNIPRVGDIFPDFALPDAHGRYRSLSSLLAAGPLVLSFNRGIWCPYCRIELEAWSDALPELAAMGCAFASVTGEVGGRAQLLAARFADPVTMLCDVDHGVALNLGLAFYLGDDVLSAYRADGIDLDQAYGSSAGLLPVPATFLLAPNGTILFAYANPDFRERAEPMDVMAALAQSGW